MDTKKQEKSTVHLEDLILSKDVAKKAKAGSNPGPQSDKRFMVDVGMKNLPFPMTVVSKVHPGGQLTIGAISINARIMNEFESRWIDKFIQVAHRHRKAINTAMLALNVKDYMKELGATMVRIDYEYPYFIEKTTPVSQESCLVRYLCTYSAKASAVQAPKILFKIEIPVITTYPGSTVEITERPFGQLSILSIELESQNPVYPEDIVALADKCALSPVYSFVTPEDQNYIIQKVHRESKSSVVTVDEIKEQLSRNRELEGFSVKCANYGMLHSYSTAIGTEKSMWVPETDVEDYELL